MAMGQLAGYIVNGSGNVGVGSFAGASVMGHVNTAVGNAAGGNVEGSRNAAYGNGAGSRVKGNNNVSLGNSAGADVEGSGNTGIGNSAGASVKGVGNIAMGRAAGQSVAANRTISIGSGIVTGAVSDNTTASADDAIALGSAATSSAVNATAIGTRAKASGQSSIAMGTGAQALAENSISIGTGNVVRGNNSGAIGDPSIINGANSYSVGNNNTIGSTTNNAFAMGNNVYLGVDADGNTTTDVSGAVALGNATSVTQPGGVALGENSAASIIAGVQGYDPLGSGKAQSTATLATGTWKATNAAISVGKADGTLTRQITGVAAGTANSDAVNVAQLKAAQTHYYSVNDGGTVKANYNNDGATGTDAIAAGVSARATGNYSAAFGPSSQATNIYSTALGYNSRAASTYSSALGYNSWARGTYSSAFGPNSQATGTYSSALGYNSQATGTYSSAFGPSSRANDYAVSMGNYAGYQNTAPRGMISIGHKAGALAKPAYTSSLIESQVNIGVGAGMLATGNRNVNIGTVAGRKATGSMNFYLGDAQGYYVTGNSNIGIGHISTTPGLANEESDPIDSSQWVRPLRPNVKASRTIGIGNDVMVTEDDTIAIGTKAAVIAPNSLAIGKENIVSGTRSGAIGDPSYVGSTGSYVLGNDNIVGSTSNNVFVVGNNVKIGATGVTVTPATATTPLSITYQDESDVSGAVALGSDTAVSAKGGVALGSNSVANRTAFETAVIAPYSKAELNATNTFAAISVGGGGKLRQIINLGDGTQDTDAVNLRQLKAVANDAAAGAVHYYSVNDGGTPKANYNNDGATGLHSLAAGVRAAAAGQNSVSVGFENTVSQTAPLNSDDSTALGQRNRITNAANSILLGADNSIATSNSVSAIGGDNVARGSSASSLTGIGNILTGSSATSIVGIGNTVSSTATPLTPTEMATVQTAIARIKANSSYEPTTDEQALIDRLSSNYVAGTANTLTNSTQNSVLGNQNTLTNGSQNFVAGFKNNLGANLVGNQILGSNVTVENGVQNGVAIGMNTQLSQTGGVALGSGSVANRPASSGSTAAGWGGYNPRTGQVDKLDADIEATRSKLAAISVGSAGKTRQITNVAAGTIDSDAVNIAQLKALGSAVAAGQTHYYSVNSTATGAGSNYNNDGATGTGAMAAGVFARASGSGSVAVGQGASATGDYGATAVGLAAGAAGRYSTALGNLANASGYQSTALGNNSVASAPQSIAIGVAEASGPSAIAIGQRANAAGNAAIAQGYFANAAGDDALALGADSSATVTGGVALGSGSVADLAVSTPGYVPPGATTAQSDAIALTTVGSMGAVSVGSAAGTRQITNVAAGTDNSDAVNVAQLKAVSAVAEYAGQGWDIGNSSGRVGNVAPGKQVDFVAGNTNTRVDVAQNTATGNSTVTVAAAPAALQYTATKAAAGGNAPNADQFTATNQATLVGAGGSTTGGVSLNNVAAAELSATSLQAVNGSQLYALGSSTRSALGGRSTFDTTTGQVIAGLSVGGTIYNNVQDALDNISVTAGSGWRMTTSQTGTGTVSGSSLTTITPGSTGTFTAGNNIAITQNDREVQIATSMTPTFNTVTADTVRANSQISAPTYVATGANPIVVSGNTGTINGLTNKTFDSGNYTSGQAATEDQLAQVDGKASAGWNVTANGKNPSNVGPGQTVDFRNTDGNIRIGKHGTDLTFNLNPNLRLSSVTTGDTHINTNGLFIKGGPSVTKAGIDAAGQKVTNVADGTAPYDAVNRGQLNALDNRLSREIDKVDDRASAGIASAMAAASVPQATIPGANLLGAGTGYYNGHSALSIGYSALSDNGKWIIRSNFSVNSEDTAVSAGVGYQW